jgi:uncharacterized protein DUF4232
VRGIVLIALLASCVSACSGEAAGHPASTCVLSLRFGARTQAPPGQFHVVLDFVNTGFGNCRLTGYPEVELIGPPDPLIGSLYALPNQKASTTTVVIRPNLVAHAVLTWLPPDVKSEHWTPGYIRVVVPTKDGPSYPTALPWRFGKVLRQDGATHPGTYIGPVRPGP